MNTNRQHVLPRQQQLTAEQIQKQREYLKQQQKLRLMAASTSQRSVTADTLIENLLGKKDTFKPVGASVGPSAFQAESSGGATGVSTAQHFDSRQAAGQPTAAEWISPNSLNFPAMYRRVWTLVGQPDGMVDTKKVFPLLLTSGLHTDVLGYIWGLANQCVAGQLSEPELYVLLALVALAQKGYSFNSANVLSLVPQPPLPNLNLGIEPQQTTLIQREDVNLQPRPATMSTITPQKAQTATFTPVMTPQLHSITPPLLQSFHSEPIVGLAQNDFDDFTDFQSASANVPHSSFQSDHTKTNNIPVSSEYKDSSLQSFEIFEPSKESSPTSFTPTVPPPASKSVVLPEPVFVQKFPTVAVLGGSGRSVGSRLANHSLGASKTNKSRLHKHHHHHHRNTPSHTATAEDDFSDFQQASGEELFPKCQPVQKPPSSHTFLLKESAIRVDSPKSAETSVSRDVSLNKSGVLGDTFLTTSVLDDSQQVSKTASNSIKQPERGSELMGTEDRYGALRALSFFSETPAESSDDFGDFFSTQPETDDDSFVEIAARVNESAVADAIPWGSKPETIPETAEFQVDDWSSFASAAPTNGDINVHSPPEVQISPAAQSTNSSEREYSVFDTVTNQIGQVDLGLGLNVNTKPFHSDEAYSVAEHEDIKGLSFSLMDISIAAPSVGLPVIAPSSSANFNETQFEEDDFGEFVGPSMLEDGNGINLQANENTLWQEEKEVDSQCGAGLWLDETKNEHPWPEEEPKYDRSKIFKGGVADNHLVSNLWLEESKGLDSQSVSSLELPGLDQAWDAAGEWRKCLQSCVVILRCAVDTFEAIVEPTVLLEVLTSNKGQDYLKDVVEVWAVCERLTTSYRQTGADPKIDALLNSAEAAWLLLKPHVYRAEVSLDPETVTDGQELCGVCLAGGAKIEFESHTYHASCANLWLNSVDNVLPALHQP